MRTSREKNICVSLLTKDLSNSSERRPRNIGVMRHFTENTSNCFHASTEWRRPKIILCKYFIYTNRSLLSFNKTYLVLIWVTNPIINIRLTSVRSGNSRAPKPARRKQNTPRINPEWFRRYYFIYLRSVLSKIKSMSTVFARRFY